MREKRRERWGRENATIVLTTVAMYKPTFYCVILPKCDGFWFRRNNKICPILICSLCCAVDRLQFAQHFVFTGNGATAEHGELLESLVLNDVKHSRIETNVCGCTKGMAENGTCVHIPRDGEKCILTQRCSACLTIYM